MSKYWFDKSLMRAYGDNAGSVAEQAVFCLTALKLH